MEGRPSPASALHCVSQYMIMYKEVDQMLGWAEMYCRYDIQHVNLLPGRADGHVRNQITSCDMCEVFLRLLSVEARISKLAMPSRPLSELTRDEEELLIYAAKILAAGAKYAAAPPQTPELREYSTSSLWTDLVHTILTRAYHSLQLHTCLEICEQVV